MYEFQIYRNKSYRTIYSGKESQVVKRFLNGHGKRRIVMGKTILRKS
jgi:hypothetical protein